MVKYSNGSWAIWNRKLTIKEKKLLKNGFNPIVINGLAVFVPIIGGSNKGLV